LKESTNLQSNSKPIPSDFFISIITQKKKNKVDFPYSGGI